ncbi:hypothetical protein FEM48_Zijuj03G0048100 [Ziziphus jujuba var. spinosa]|uniref:Glucosamine inositolphosphorylceramide transferase 1 n=1 Tax=Ziziphus jujuba var. spinosa TaxID=714518 RepID=A0A978VN96_ZIZJJ|nr:hypothetical protein FEM48_Zijuj03G0048100 [Ziziphus jujuba var. spinosa]
MATLYTWFAFSPNVRTGLVVSVGCQEDNEGSWSVGVFFGDSPFSLKPIETMNVWKDETAAWPVANPVLTCASVSDAGFPSNFVADPFLYIQVEVDIVITQNITKNMATILPQNRTIIDCSNLTSGLTCYLMLTFQGFSHRLGNLLINLYSGDTFYLFFETKNAITMQGDIGVAKSSDKGATWKHLGIALDEEWHLSYPYVFDYNDQIYMMPESSEKGELRLYRALNFPLQWKLEKVIIEKPLVDSFIIYHNNMHWLFGSDHSGFGTKKNGQLEIWYSNSPLGPWKPHKKNPIYNVDKSLGARNGGRPFVYKGHLYRVGQDCGETYGRRVRGFKVEVLTTNDYKEVEVPLGLIEPTKGRNAWNGVRHHHLDVQQLSSGEWVAVMDGDRVPSGDPIHRFILGWAAVSAVVALIALLGVMLGAVNFMIPHNWCFYSSGKRSDASLAWEKSHFFSSKGRRLCSRLNRVISALRGRIKHNTCAGRLVLAITLVLGVAILCVGVKFIYGGNGAEEPYPWKGQHSQFTLLTMTYDARLWNLKLYIKHYSRCSSVREIVVVWNKGKPPALSDFDSAVPVRIRVENQNSLNNRFKLDSLIKTRAVLELDDDIMMTCDDIERGFKVWRQYPDRLVGFYPRLIDGSPLKYRGEKHARRHKGYNMILTGAAFIDSQVAFDRYWSEEAKQGREEVEKYFNCEDVLMNYLYANASSSRTVEYVRPAWAIDTSKFSSAAISRNTKVHYQIRSECLMKFSNMYGSLSRHKWRFDGRKDGWDL